MEIIANNLNTSLKILSVNKIPKTLPNSELNTGRHNGKSRHLVKEILMEHGYTSSTAERFLTDIENGD